jgi:hypothetical protein
MEIPDLGVALQVSPAVSASVGWTFPVERTCVNPGCRLLPPKFVICCPDCARFLVASEIRTVTTCAIFVCVLLLYLGAGEIPLEHSMLELGCLDRATVTAAVLVACVFP